MIVIRTATPSDSHYVVDTDIKCFEYPWSPDYWRAVSSEYQVKVATLDRQVIGVAAYSRETDDHGLPGVWLRKIAVKPKYRRQYAGSLLFQATVDFARAINAVEIRLVVPELQCYGPGGVAKFLLACGMQCSEVMKDQFEFSGEVEDGLLFKKVLRVV